jgi:RNA-directed DNA polymerase
VLDRFIQQARLPVWPPEWDKTFADGSDGFRPGRAAHHALARAPRYVGEGYGWVVDLDLEKVFDRVNHDKLMSLVKARVADRRVLPRIDRDLKAGVLTDEGLEATVEGTPHGGPGSPLLANRLWDGLERAWERRGHRFVRDADDGHLDVKRARAGPRVLARVTRVLACRLKLAVNAAKRAVDRPWRRTFLGLTFTGHRPNRRRVRDKALQACQQEGRRKTSRTRGVSLARVVGDLRRDLEGWSASCGCAEAPSIVKELDAWIRRRLRGDLWKPWGRRRYRALRRRGVGRDLAWHPGKSAHGPWRFSRSPALAIALPGRSVDGLGLPRLSRGAHR